MCLALAPLRPQCPQNLQQRQFHGGSVNIPIKTGPAGMCEPLIFCQSDRLCLGVAILTPGLSHSIN
ncbi:hypothetical protein, partial [Rhizobium leguminosarum]|uniref:hypothetical protein n=1 Tax=Rhizobium leguminosarum TaxID=384 RepID=UPI00197D55F8